MIPIFTLESEKVIVKLIYTCPYCGKDNLINKEDVDHFTHSLNNVAMLRCDWCTRKESLGTAVANGCISKSDNAVYIVRAPFND